MKKHQLREEYVAPVKQQRNNATTTSGKGSERHPHVGTKHHSDSLSVCCWMDYESFDSIQNLSMMTAKTPFAIHTQVASSTMTEIFLHRLHKEIIIPFRFTLSSQIQLLDSDRTVHDATERRNLIQQRILFGFNNVSKLLFDASSNNTAKPSLVVVVHPDTNYQNNDSHVQQPSTSIIGAPMLQHIPLLTNEMNIPLLLLPSSYISENQQGGKGETMTNHVFATIFGCSRSSCHNSYNKLIQFACIAFTRQPHQQELPLLRHVDTEVLASTTTIDQVVDNTLEENHHLHIHNSIDSFVHYITGKMQN